MANWKGSSDFRGFTELRVQSPGHYFPSSMILDGFEEFDTDNLF